ncbi:24893_t:CDS:2, partial [Gigaspora margarita]
GKVKTRQNRLQYLYEERKSGKKQSEGWDPKDGELCLNRVKPEETLVEAHSGSDVQINCQIWVWGERLIEPSSSWFLLKFPSG